MNKKNFQTKKSQYKIEWDVMEATFKRQQSYSFISFSYYKRKIAENACIKTKQFGRTRWMHLAYKIRAGGRHQFYNTDSS